MKKVGRIGVGGMHADLGMHLVRSSRMLAQSLLHHRHHVAGVSARSTTSFRDSSRTSIDFMASLRLFSISTPATSARQSDANHVPSHTACQSERTVRLAVGIRKPCRALTYRTKTLVPDPTGTRHPNLASPDISSRDRAAPGDRPY